MSRKRTAIISPGKDQVEDLLRIVTDARDKERLIVARMAKCGGRLKAPRPSHHSQTPGAVEHFKMEGWAERRKRHTGHLWSEEKVSVIDMVYDIYDRGTGDLENGQPRAGAHAGGAAGGFVGCV